MLGVASSSATTGMYPPCSESAPLTEADTRPGVFRSRLVASGSTRETEVGKTAVWTSVPLGTSPLLLLRYEPTVLPAFTTGSTTWCTCLDVSLIRAQHMGSIITKAPTGGAESAHDGRIVSDESVLITR